MVLLSFTPGGLQQLIDGMHDFCASMGLTISPTKTEVVVFSRASPQPHFSWHVGAQQLPVSSSFKYLGLIFHDSGSMTSALARLLQNGQGARSRLAAKHKELHCDKSFPMMRRLFDAVVKPTVSYGCEVWGTFCTGDLLPELRQMTDLQLAFFRQICRLRKSVSAPIIFTELAEVQRQRSWWLQVVGFMQRLANMPQASLHAEILSDNILDAQQAPGFDNWAAGVHKQYTSLGMASPFLGGRIQFVDAFGFQRAMVDRENKVWAGLHISPRSAPSKKANFCTYLCWFSRPERCSVEPYYDLPLSIKKLRSILHFRMGSHALPVEQGRLDRPAVPRHLRRCTFCTTRAVGDERHCLFDCPHFGGLRSEHAQLFHEAHGAMRSLMWHKNQKSVCAMILAIVNEAQT